ncbi:MAG: hypothetical protein C5B50_21315 [Verrucomicrobia bacterium]|nr:MAG: hypothetical protein C5B50_21315 [Verrucomicrobiota bacterium]
MKKLLLSICLLAGLTSPGFAQSGYVLFAATTQVIKTNALLTAGYAAAYNGSPISTAPGPGVSWYYELLVAPTSQTTIDSSLSGWAAICEGTNISIAGRMFGTDSPDGQAALVPGYTSTATANFAVVAWSSNLGSDWNSVFAGRPTSLVSGVGTYGHASWGNTTAPAPAGWDPNYASKLDAFNAGPGAWYGISAVATLALAPNGGPYNFVFGTENGGLSGLSMNYYAVPEPASLALLGLGAASLLLPRRRK